MPPTCTTCTTCNDTRRIDIGDRTYMCTYCPRPCRYCASHNGRGAYCEAAPCGCGCHLGVAQPITRPCQWCGRAACATACPECWSIQEVVINAPPPILSAILKQHAPSLLPIASDDPAAQPPWLPDLVQILGWQGGTYTQALREIRRLVYTRFNVSNLADRMIANDHDPDGITYPQIGARLREILDRGDS